MTMNRIFRKILLVAVAATMIGTPNAIAGKSKDFPPYKLGSIMPLTGGAAWVGLVMNRGIEMAIEEINASGDLPMELTLVKGDHKGGDAVAGANAARKMIAIDKVKGLFPSFNNICPIVAKLAAPAKVPMINGGGTSDEVLNVPYLHNTITQHKNIFEPMLKYLVEEKKIKRPVQILVADPGSMVDAQMADRILKEQYGIDVLAVEKINMCAKTDFRAELAKLKYYDPDCLLVYCWDTDQTNIIKQAREMNINIPIATWTVINTDKMPELGETVTGVVVTAAGYLDLDTDVPWAQEYIKSYRAKFGETPEFYGANYYEGVYVFRDAIKHVLDNGGDPYDGEQIEKAISDIKYFRTLFEKDKMEFMPNGDVMKIFATYTYEPGQKVRMIDMTRSKKWVPPADK